MPRALWSLCLRWAKKVPNWVARHTHSGDNHHTCKHVHTRTRKSDAFDVDILSRHDATALRCDVYTPTAPCQYFSTSGQGWGSSPPPRGAVTLKVLQRTKAKKPRVVLSDHVPSLTARRSHILRFLETFMQCYAVA